jgi:hypothetical protein
MGESRKTLARLSPVELDSHAAIETSYFEEQFGMVLDLAYHATFKRVARDELSFPLGYSATCLGPACALGTSNGEEPIVGVPKF